MSRSWFCSEHVEYIRDSGDLADPDFRRWCVRGGTRCRLSWERLLGLDDEIVALGGVLNPEDGEGPQHP